QKSAERHHGIGHVTALLVEHDIVDGSDLFATRVVHGRSRDHFARDQIGGFLLFFHFLAPPVWNCRDNSRRRANVPALPGRRRTSWKNRNGMLPPSSSKQHRNSAMRISGLKRYGFLASAKVKSASCGGRFIT